MNASVQEGRRRKAAVLCVLSAVAEACDDDLERIAATSLSTSGRAAAVTVGSGSIETRGGTPGRVWNTARNDPNWFFKYAMRPDFRSSPSWKSLFRVSPAVFDSMAEKLGPVLEKQTTNYRIPVRPEVRIAAFLHYVGGATCEKTACQLGIGRSTVNHAVHEVAKEICDCYGDSISFPTELGDVHAAMEGFKEIAGLPYCVGAIDGTHIRWPMCPEEQFYEYRCYKNFASIVLFACCTADRRFTFVDIGKPGVLGDSSIFEDSTLKRRISEGLWLGREIPDLMVANIPIRPFLIGDCAFAICTNVMKTCSEQEKASNPMLNHWDPIASETRKPIECAFGMLKKRFPILRDGVRLLHEDDIVRLIYACVLLHNLSIDKGDIQEDPDFEEDTDEETEEQEVTGESEAGRKQRDALLYFVTSHEK